MQNIPQKILMLSKKTLKSKEHSGNFKSADSSHFTNKSTILKFTERLVVK
jgi:hypothetical protein